MDSRPQIARLRDDGKVITNENKLLDPAKLLAIGQVQPREFKNPVNGPRKTPVEMQRLKATDMLPAHYTCTCPFFKTRSQKHQNAYLPIEQLTCPHLQQLLGEEYEDERTKNKGRLQGFEDVDYQKAMKEASRPTKRQSSPIPTLPSSSSSPSGTSKPSTSSNRIIKPLPRSKPSSPPSSSSSSSIRPSRSQMPEAPDPDTDPASIPSFLLENLRDDPKSKQVIADIINSNALQYAKATGTRAGHELAEKGSIAASRRSKKEKREEPKTNHFIERDRAVGKKPKHAERCMLATTWDPNTMNAEGWLWNEKLDGVRAIWDGQHFRSRNNIHYSMPMALINKMPTNVHLDGEFWMGRDNFDQLSGLCRSDSTSQSVANVKFVCFDLIDTQMLFEERFNLAVELIGEPKSPDEIIASPEPFGVFMLETKKLKSKDGISANERLLKILDEILDKGGEGVMLRKPQSKYERKRSESLRRLKTFYDAEALLLGYQEGSSDGKWVGQVGSLILLMECGKVFTCGSGMKHSDHYSPPKVGSIIKYKFQEMTPSMTPRFPIYQGVCHDKDRPKDATVRSQVTRAAERAGESGETPQE